MENKVENFVNFFFFWCCGGGVFSNVNGDAYNNRLLRACKVGKFCHFLFTYFFTMNFHILRKRKNVYYLLLLQLF